MANAIAANYALAAANNTFSAVWKLTRMMKKAGWTTVAHSDGVTKTSAGTNNNDSWGSNSDPATDTYPAFNAAAPWIVLRGPSTVKALMTSAPTGTPIRGEIVTQETSGATGELLGYVFDTGTSSGWAVIMPRTGTFDGTHNITGNSSSCIFTISSVKLFYREVMIAKNSANTTGGTIYYICADSSGESAQLFSTLAGAAGCTATVFPGGGGTGNSFPTAGIVARGVSGATTHANLLYDTTGFNTNAQLMCANATADVSTTADGSFWCVVANTAITDAQSVFGFCRVDDQEPGDIDPYMWIYSTTTTQSAYTGSTTMSSALSEKYFVFTTFCSNSTSNLSFFGNMSRDGYSTRDKSIYYLPTFVQNPLTGTSGTTLQYPTNWISAANYRLTNSPSSTPPLIRIHPIMAYVKSSANEVFVKGRLRWLAVTSIGNKLDTMDTKSWLCIEARATTGNPAVMIGPYDGSTTPTSS